MVAFEDRLVDADNHYYEPYDCFTRHIEPEFRDRTIHVVSTGDGLGRIHLGDDRLRFMSVMPGDFASAPGALQGLFEGAVDDGFTHVDVVRAADHPEFIDRAARLRLMDEQRVQAAIMLPTLGVVVEHEMRHDVPLTYASLRAFNRWLDEDWGFAYQDRIFAVPLLSLLDLDKAILELDRVLAAGARMIHLRPGPAFGRSPADPYFDPFWARVEEADVPVVFHVSHSGYYDLVATAWGEDPKNPSHMLTPLQWVLGGTERPITDTLAALVLHNLFLRFPGLRVVSIENGADWVAHLLKSVDKAARLGRRGVGVGGPVTEKPSETLREHLYVVPFPEDDNPALIQLLGADHVLFGSDYPHPEGLRRPLDYLSLLGDLDEERTRKIMRDNTARLLHLTGAIPPVSTAQPAASGT